MEFEFDLVKSEANKAKYGTISWRRRSYGMISTLSMRMPDTLRKRGGSE